MRRYVCRLVWGGKTLETLRSTIRLLAVLAIGSTLATGSFAGDAVVSFGPLSDRDFFRSATCGAPPKGDCVAPVYRWKKRTLKMHLVAFPDGFQPQIAMLIPIALDNAIEQINGAGAGIQLALTFDPKAADITIHPTMTAENSPVSGIPGIPDGSEIGAGFVVLKTKARNEIKGATIVLSNSLLPYDVRSIVLEEVFQALGFIFDIENRFYNARSVLSQAKNVTTTIKGQDALILHLLYPRN
jgi:hypothetical protein